MNIKNIFFGISLLILSGLIFFFGSSFPNYVVRGNKLPGPKFFPFTLAVIIIILGTYYIIKSLIMIRLKRIPKDATLAPSDKITLDGTKNVIAIIVGIIFFVPLINLLSKRQDLAFFSIFGDSGGHYFLDIRHGFQGSAPGGNRYGHVPEVIVWILFSLS